MVEVVASSSGTGVDSRSERLSSWGSDGGRGMSVPSGTKATVMSWLSVRRMSPGSPLYTRPSSAGSRVAQVFTWTLAGLPSHWSPLFLASWSGRSSLVLETLTFTVSKNTPSLAFLPAARDTNGWMWTIPSAWVWMPSGSAASTMLGANVPQTK